MRLTRENLPTLLLIAAPIVAFAPLPHQEIQAMGGSESGDVITSVGSQRVFACRGGSSELKAGDRATASLFDVTQRAQCLEVRNNQLQGGVVLALIGGGLLVRRQRALGDAAAPSAAQAEAQDA